ncbi:alpha-glucosidase/alpha-galactosidase [Zobellella denitrificans]|uniref:alpha-glucosidase/alpha-galactosidase n=1 Tax=Zobellella denitrificans TaxID=347534 RepID=UPI000B8BDB34|nr:alpha-glucosidase/alpha-galactosidase [Zobellella denitrificans]OXS15916.1 alpha-glucosidase/alpha-galactosidase [Zobellella denitrificans]
MSIRVTIIGAGSTVFMRNIVRDLLHKPALKHIEIALYDIDARRLAESERVVRQLVSALGAPARVQAYADRRQALAGATAVFTLFQVGGYRPCTLTDFEVPRRYGLQQTIGDTLGVAGIMRGLRTIPVLLSLAEDMRELCPRALLMNYVNPMGILSLAMQRLAPDIRYVGLCHSVQGTAEQLATDLGVPPADLVYRCAGINHMAFYHSFQQRLPDGALIDLYPRLRALAEQGLVPDDNRVRYEILKRFGYFVTESSEHFAEYSPWFIKRDRPDLLERFNVPLDEYPRRCERQIADWAEELKRIESGEAMALKESHEYAAGIVNALVTHEPVVIYGNVLNRGAIENLPADCCVEVACLVDGNGVQPQRFGRIQPQLAALIQTNVNVQMLTVEAVVHQDPQYLYHAAYLDPHTAAELDLEQIHGLVDDLRRAHGDWLPEWARLG